MIEYVDDSEFSDDSDELSEHTLGMFYRNINKVFNADFIEETTIEELNDQITKDFNIIHDPKVVELSKDMRNEIATITDNLNSSLSIARIKDESFLETEMKSLIVSSRKVLEVLEQDIKKGTAPRTYEVYAKMVDSITGQFKELRNLNQSVANLVIENKKQHLEEVKEDHKMTLSSNDALDMYMNAKNNSQMGAIDADFNIIDDGDDR